MREASCPLDCFCKSKKKRLPALVNHQYRANYLDGFSSLGGFTAS